MVPENKTRTSKHAHVVIV